MIIRGRRKWLCTVDYCGKRLPLEIIGNPYFRRRWFNGTSRRHRAYASSLYIIINNILYRRTFMYNPSVRIWTSGRQVTWPPPLPLPRSWHRVPRQGRLRGRFLHVDYNYIIITTRLQQSAFVPRSRRLIFWIYNLIYVYNIRYST